MTQFVVEVKEVEGNCMDCCFRDVDECPEDDCKVEEDIIYEIAKIKSVDDTTMTN